ncbi:SusC/RagA family TonB-linked outer membrane protein [Chryseobacterium populi]|uniref:TonB-linked outer membrane protein, SusC/RagA family n=1 Tax=Chryseobacterium populi TaxID=1144316 RepID=J2TBX4_9FLAO|nr:SusC/RagA family TonB-linked outer membrane protein [Chryseobacterium populi]EJL75647.1 TonB-linked outer membrane protein, SusC/RagA family [Chryseobacterium populi]
MRKTVIPILLAFPLFGYAQDTKSADTTKTVNIQEVVVTSLGIKRQARSLTYSSQQIGGDDLTEVKTPNLLNSINGKVSNVQINKTNGGVGGSVRVVMRGDKSTRNSQPLYVIDGIPIINNTGVTGTEGPKVDYFASMPDTGDVLSTINPEDIESINFLKGASAAALYGAQGSNGAILITTKKGTVGRSSLSYTSSLTFDKVYGLPELQHSYLQTTPYDPANGNTGSYDSWGAKGSSKDYTKDFFQTGATWINSVSFQAGNEKTTNFFSLGNTTNKGIIPTSYLDQYNVNYRTTSKFLNDKLVLDANVMASLQNSKNRLSPGSYFSPITNLYWLPRGVDFDQFAQNYSYFEKSRYLDAQNWWAVKPNGEFADSETQNPYWILNKNPVITKNKNLYGSAALSYTINSWLTAKVRGNYNYFSSDSQRNVAAYSQPTVLGLETKISNGKIYKNTIEKTTTYGDFLLIGNPKINDDISLDFTLGTSISDLKYSITNIENNRLFVANLFTLNNLDWGNQQGEGVFGNGRSYTITNPHRQDQSVFASASFGYKSKVYLDLTFRNDWSSTLAGTGNNGIDYESIGANGILTEIFSLPQAISFWKVRASYATVGNALDPTSTMPQPEFNGGVITGFYSSAPVSNEMFRDLYPKPEFNRTFEAGTELRMFHNKLSFDFTFYNSVVSNQYLKGVDAATNFGVQSGKVDINAGKIQNIGFESSLSYKIFNSEKFGWTTTFNASANKNRIKELLPLKYYPDPDKLFVLTGGGFNMLKVGGSFGDLYGTVFKRDSEGRIIVGANGVPLVDSDKRKQYLGNPNPKFMLGLNNNFSIGRLDISFLVDGRFGGQVLGFTQSVNDGLGVSQASADARDAGGVSIPNAVYENGTPYTGLTDAEDYYKSVGGRDGINEAYIYKATAVRLRQASISYTLKTNSKIFKDATVSIIGTNLFFFYKDAPFDPEQVSGVNPGGVGVDMFGTPITRSLGVSLKANF